jgi:catechol 2,3-dioxygenase-like lactoylglutathione lyase family enzyme
MRGLNCVTATTIEWRWTLSSPNVRLNHVMLPASNVESSAKFYVRLGLTQIVADYPHYARLLAPDGDTTLSLDQATDALQNGASIHFEVEDVDLTVQQLKQAGFDFVCDPVDQPYLWREAILLDPDGHRIFIFHAGEHRIDPPWRLRT